MSNDLEGPSSPSALAQLVRDVASTMLDAAVGRSTEKQLRRRLEALAPPGVRLDLIPHREPFDGSCSFDVLLRSGSRTLSVGMAGAQVPWPLRGVVAAREFTLVRVNGASLSFAEALEHLDWVFTRRQPLLELLRAAQLLAEDLDQLEVTAEQVQDALDAFRRRHGLLSAAQTQRWLADRGMPAHRLIALARRAAAHAVLRRHLVASQVEEVLAARRHEWDHLLVVWADVEITAMDAWTVQLDRRRTGGRAGLLDCPARELPPEFSALATAETGVCVQLDDGAGPAYAVVLDRRPAAEATVRTGLEEELFARYLDEQRQGADVAWHYGDTAVTPR